MTIFASNHRGIFLKGAFGTNTSQSERNINRMTKINIRHPLHSPEEEAGQKNFEIEFFILKHVSNNSESITKKKVFFINYCPPPRGRGEGSKKFWKSSFPLKTRFEQYSPTNFQRS